MRIQRTFLILFCLAAPAIADEAATVGRQFLLLPSSARQSAMGGSSAALGGDAWGLFGNPAALSTLDRSDLVLDHLSWFGGANLESAAYAQPAPGLGVLGGGLSLYWMHPFDNTGGAEAPFSALGYTGRLGVATRLPGEDRMAFGAVLGYTGMDLGGMDSTHDLTLDLGMLYRTNGVPLSLGASARNISLLSVAGTAPALAFRMGAALELGNSLLTLEASRVQDQSTGLMAGGELRLGPVALRAGLSVDDGSGATPVASFGAGFHLDEAVRVDYAASSLGDLGLVQWISAELPLDTPRPLWTRAPAFRKVVSADPTPEPDPTAATLPSKPVPALAPPYRKSYDIFQKALVSAPSKSRHTPIPASFGSNHGFPLTTSVKEGSVEIAWTPLAAVEAAHSPGTVGETYNVYVSIVPGAEFRKLNGTPLSQPHWEGAMGLRGMTYYFQVRVVGPDGTETASSEVKDVDLP